MKMNPNSGCKTRRPLLCKCLGKLALLELKIQKEVYLQGFFFGGLNVFFVFYSFRPNNLNV